MNSGVNELALFEALRLHPWKDQDKLKIDGFIAQLQVTDKVSADRYQKDYDKKMLDYIDRLNAEQGLTTPVAEIVGQVVVPAVPSETPVVELTGEVKLPKIKKIKNPKKASSPHA